MEVVRQSQTAPALGIVAALPHEVGGLLRHGGWERVPSPAPSRLYRGALRGVDVLLAVSGMGRAASEAAAEDLLQRFHPGAVVAIGFAGGLAPHLAPRALVVADAVVPASEPQDGALRPDAALLQRARDALATVQAPHACGLLLTATEVVASPEGKAALGAATGALAVDMESAWVGGVCRRHDTPFLAVRAVVDSVGDALPAVLARTPADDAGLSRRMWPHVARPWLLPRLLRLARAAARARASLTAFVDAFAAGWASGAPERAQAVHGGRSR